MPSGRRRGHVLTASDRTVDRERAAEAGVDEFVAKPFGPGALRDRVQTLLGLP